MKLGGALKISLQGIDYVSARTLSGAGMFFLITFSPCARRLSGPEANMQNGAKEILPRGMDVLLSKYQRFDMSNSRIPPAIISA